MKIVEKPYKDVKNMPEGPTKDETIVVPPEPKTPTRGRIPVMSHEMEVQINGVTIPRLAEATIKILSRNPLQCTLTIAPTKIVWTKSDKKDKKYILDIHTE